MSTANAALLQLTGGTSQTTPASNDVTGPGFPFWDNAEITTTQAVVLTFYYVGAESGYDNTLHVTGVGGGAHTENNVYPGSWSGALQLPISITLESGQDIPMFFTSSGWYAGAGAWTPAGYQLAPGDGNVLAGGSIGFSVLTCTTSPACFSTALAGDTIAFLLDDGGGGLDDNHDDYVGYIVASPVPLPAAVWLLLSGVGALGAASRRRKA